MKPIVCLLLFLLFTSAYAQPAPSPTEAALDKLNASFRNQYSLNRQENMAALPLVIVLDGANVTWLTHGEKHETPVPLVHYTETKVLLHAVLGVYGLGSRIVRAGGTGTAAEWKDAHELQDNIDSAIQLTSKTTLDAADQTLLHSILVRLRDSVAQWISRGSLNRAQLEQSLRSVRADTLVLANERGVSHYQDVCDILNTIRKSVTPADWDQALVVVPGSPAAREDNVEVAAAMNAFGRASLKTRIFYAESIYDVDGAIQFLGALQNDRGLSEVFFDNPDRMWRDLLSDEVKTKVGGDFYPRLEGPTSHP